MRDKQKEYQIKDGLFIAAFNKMSTEVHETAVRTGWWDVEGEKGTRIALMHEELSETLKAYRKGNPPDKHIPEFDNATVELADTIVRIMDFGQHYNMRIAEALIAKAEFNKTRPRKHGKEF